MNIGMKIRNARKNMEMSQEALADSLGLSVQAVSKWECGLSFPDITLLPVLTKTLNVSLDYLLLDDITQFHKSHATSQISLPDDDTLRIIQCIGNRVLSADEVNKNSTPIPLQIPENLQENAPLHIDIQGKANIQGNIHGDINVGGSLGCDRVTGDLNIGGSVSCTSITGDVCSGGNISCDQIRGNVMANSITK